MSGSHARQGLPPTHRDDAGAAATAAARPTPRVTYISWAESCSRSDHTARELGGSSHMVYAPQFGSRASTIVFKYLSQAWRTWRLLVADRPDAIFVMTPPLFAAVPAFLYAWRAGGRVALDAHSAAFLHPRWRRLQWLQRWMCRRALTTLVHNEHIARYVTDAGGHAIVVPDVPITFETINRFPRDASFVVAVVCSFNPDEPVREIVEAARRLPDVRFFVTGNPRHLSRAIAGELPANVTLTGFLDTASYGGLLTDADAVLTLTTRNHTMLRGAYEAIYQGTPVIVSDWPLLRDAFPEGAEYADNTPDQIARAVELIRAAPLRYRAGAARLRALKLDRWQATRAAILDRVTGKAASEVATPGARTVVDG